jgi:site-specific recombinase XerD
VAATVKAVELPACARVDCGHAHGSHRKKTIKKRVLFPCTEPGCTCRTLLEPNEDGKPRPTAPNADKKYPGSVLTPGEFAALLALCGTKSLSGCRNRALLLLMAASGLRLSEAVGDRTKGREGLRVSDVDLPGHSLRILHTKSGVPQTRGFDPAVTDALARWIDMRKGMGLRNGPLFCTIKATPQNPVGSPIHPQEVRNLLHRLAAQAGLEKRVHPHALRHTFASGLEQEGVHLTTIQALLGHSSPAITAGYLAKLTNAQAVKALDSVRLPGLEAATGADGRVLKISERKDPDGVSRYEGYCSECGTGFETNITASKRRIYSLLLPAFDAHICRDGASEPPWLEEKRAARRASHARWRAKREEAGLPTQAPRKPVWPQATCSGCGEKRLLRGNGTIGMHRVKTAEGTVQCDGAGLPPLEERQEQ